MSETKSSKFSKNNLLLVFLVLVALGSQGYFWWQSTETDKQISSLEAEISRYQNELALREDIIDELSENLEMTSDELDDTENRLRDERDRNDAMEDQVRDLAGTVSDLDKLSKTDEELLQKYSKVSFLNEHYVPSDLSEVDNEWKYDEDRGHQLHSKVMPYFEDMVEDAKDDGVDLWVSSAYRSFEYQSQLKGAYTVTYGSGANAFSADQGFSEHQLGTTVDFTTSGIGGGLNGFGDTEAYQWLLDNAYKYGFVLSYPPDNSYYVYEPWHWRFVGEELAEDLHNDGLYFYDLPQREIDQYLLHIFD